MWLSTTWYNLEYVLCRVAVHSCVYNLPQHILEYCPLTVAVHLYVCVSVCERLSTMQHILDDGLCTVAVHSYVCQLTQHNAVWRQVHTQLQSSLCVCVCVNEPSLYMTSKLWVLDIIWFNFEPKPNTIGCVFSCSYCFWLISYSVFHTCHPFHLHIFCHVYIFL